jgi:hypothetical protein
MLQMEWEQDDVKNMADAYLQVMKAWSWSSLPDSAERCQDLLDEFRGWFSKTRVLPARLRQNVYATTMTAWARSGHPDSADRAQVLWEMMEADRAHHSDHGDAFAWNMTVYGALLQALARAGEGERAQAVLEDMLEEVRRSGNKATKPDTKCFNSVIIAWNNSNAKGAFRRAEDIFQRLLESDVQPLGLKPDIASYNAVLAALSGTKDAGTARRGDKYFQRLKEHYYGGTDDLKNRVENPGRASCRPTAVTYNLAILLWTNVRSPEALDKAATYLNEMITLYEAGNRSLRPDRGTFKAFMSVLRKSEHADREQLEKDVGAMIQKFQ